MLIKNQYEIKKIKEGGKILGFVLSEITKMAREGVTTLEIDERAEELILKAGGKPAFKGFTGGPSDPPFPTTICSSLNSGLVHGIAKKEDVLKNGDIFSIDIGMEYPLGVEGREDGRGWFTDTALTVAIGTIDPKVKELLRVTQKSLEVGMQSVKPGLPVSVIGKEIEKYVKSQGKYGIITDLVGHGVGHEVHEEPRVPNYYDRNLDKFILRPGMVIAIEPMVSLGSPEIETSSDGWTIEMADGAMCGHYEHTVAVTKSGCEVMTRRPMEKLEKLF